MLSARADTAAQNENSIIRFLLCFRSALKIEITSTFYEKHKQGIERKRHDKEVSLGPFPCQKAASRRKQTARFSHQKQID